MATPFDILALVNNVDFDKTELGIIGLAFIGVAYVLSSALTGMTMNDTVILAIVGGIITGGALGVGNSLGYNKAQNEKE